MLASPLRYPGGKAKLFNYFVELIKRNGFFDHTYYEPFAGGAGLALKLLSSGFVKDIVLNDLDRAVYAFWHSVLYRTDEFCQMIEATSVTIDEWHRQKLVWADKSDVDLLKLGFATFFLNRTNRSGIIDGGGPIGGYAQEGEWKLDVRFNKKQHIADIKNISRFRDGISVTNADAVDFLNSNMGGGSRLFYLDPPYYVKGSKLYRNSYKHPDHCTIRDILLSRYESKWVVSYDDVAEVREIYSALTPTCYSLHYSAGTKTSGREVIYFSGSVLAPSFPGFEQTAA